ncbi:J domain-containing protein [Parvularcula dongshanensis]|uniref:J domain-containing protein n=1 Tax=Parvularcula dongshanensis TaxID=1173995 RepID=A0A840I2N0_9PROT|nr:J domain-containing protein [Parvularcula dongshanensis]MBB4658533.1 hypothetical protein [Parvularcula dongshanensis]
MFEKTVIRQGKSKLMVSLCLTDGRQVEGEVFVCPGERLSDLLNDSRAFVPVESPEGEIEVVAKQAILSARLMAQEPVEVRDPYGLLRVERTATDSEIRTAWMEKVKASHPDRLASLGMDESVVYAARKVCQRINGAYDDIIRQRRGSAAA